MALVRPGDNAELGRHQRAQGASLGLEGAEIGRGEAETEQALTLEGAPAGSKPRSQQSPHHEPERGGVEVLQIDGVKHCEGSCSEVSRSRLTRLRGISIRLRAVLGSPA